ncbi:MAG: isoprenylcysteine carboxylmethyltransferase family protein [Chloroflexota bacterium]|nr:MAG: isoprenylcysteine carboxylmethyltransferase family protein [Chloroflexota bacterium]
MERAIRLIVAILLLLFAWIAVGGFRQSIHTFQRPRTPVMRALYSPAIIGLALAACVPLVKLGWRPLPWRPSSRLRQWLSLLGGLVFLAGWVLYVWGRIALGRNFGVSTAIEAPLRANHTLVTSGPYVLVRHPMYLGVIIATWGLVAVFRTWAMLVFAISFLSLPIRARTEERALAARFGPAWEAYAARVPGFVPRMRVR